MSDGKRSTEKKAKTHPGLQLIAGGAAGFVESSVCHPLDTIKTRMQLRRQQATFEAVRARSSLHEPGMSRFRFSSLAEPPLFPATPPSFSLPRLHDPGLRLPASLQRPSVAKTAAPAPRGATVSATLGPLGTARRIVQREGFLALYKGLSAVYTGIVPKMAIRFVSFEQYRDGLQRVLGPPPPGHGLYSPSVTFFAGLASGLTEAVLIVTPAEVCKIRMQSQYNSLIDTTQLSHRKYTNVAQTALTIVREEGFTALYKGVVPTMMRQGCNQAVNFSAYNYFKRLWLDWQNQNTSSPGAVVKLELEHWQSLLLGGVSGGFGPLVNNPLDVVKTRMQKQVVIPGKTPKYSGLLQSCVLIAKEEGYPALWKGITPRLMRIMPGQAITFMTYEAVSSKLQQHGFFV